MALFRKSHAAGMLLLFSGVIAAAGLAADLMIRREHAFWIGAEPGVRAVIGAAVAVLLALAAHAMRLLLGGRADGEGRRAGDHT